MRIFKHAILIAVFVCSAAVAVAQNQMSDVQVLEYLKAGVSQGKSHNQIASELIARGVDREQAERVKQMFERQQLERQQETSASILEDRTHTVNADIDQTPREVKEESAVRVYGRDVFRNKSLNFAPGENLATPRNYRLGPGDEVIIDIFGANQVTLRQLISPEGSINVDVLGPVYLSGMTIEEADKFLKSKLAGIYGGLNRSSTRTDIRLSLGQIRSIQVNVLGEVNNAGTYVVSAFSTVFHVLYLAGGVSDLGSLRNIVVNRNGTVVGNVDVYDFLRNGSRESDIRLEEGDVVMVRPYSCMVEVSGEVKRPMFFEMKDGETLDDLLEYAGGFTSNAFSGNVTVNRRNGHSYELRTVAKSEFGHFGLTDGDQVAVGMLKSLYENRIIITGAVYQPGDYELCDEVRTVRQLVAKAGGLLPDAFTNRAVLQREHDDKTREVVAVNLGRVIDGSDPDIILQKNDELYITSKSDIQEVATMAISGYVQRPGTFPFAEKTSVEDLIIMAGGLREGASLARVDISRRKRDVNGLVRMDEVGELVSVSLKDGFEVDGSRMVYLEPYDEVIVHASPAYNAQTHVSVFGEANFAGSFTLTSRNERLSDLVRKAGGITKYAYPQGACLYRNMTDEEREQLKQVLQNRQSDGYSRIDTMEVYYLEKLQHYKVAIQLDEALRSPGSEYDIELVEGDVLEIPVIRNTVRIIGSVMMPSVLSYQPGKRARDYIRDCGGYGMGAMKSRAYVIHMNGRSEKMKGSTRILPGDEIIIPERQKQEGVSDRLFERAISSVTAVAALGQAAGYMYLILQKDK